ncbi:fluoride efflux transporter CrcB [Psychrobacillus sp.]|uniref:fluoride efflux transporter CrcB n=1 Tax=Psychrobacillus sp. TaxID=1871623 RepID=UPI0028BD68B1|nr:fluoride efflux transporter CrcB [Psychrobacillus sp.]
MSITYVVAVCIGGYLGAISRYSIAQKLNQRVNDSIPYGTLAVNLIGSFFLGFIVSIGLDKMYIMLLGTGFLGAFTTFSTFNNELRKLQQYKKKWLLYFTFTYVGGLCCVFFGFFIGSRII